MIRINNIEKRFGDHVALQIDEIAIDPQACVGLVGNNGAGKTTLFRSVLDLLPLDQGAVYLKDVRVNQSEEWKHFSSAFLDEGFLIDYLRPEEYFHFIGKTRDMSKEEVDAQLEDFRDLFKDEVLGRKRFIRDLSKGNQKKVGIAAAFIGNPEIVLLDEPFANLDPSSQFLLREIIRKKNQEQGITFFISSHDLTHVTEICSRIILLDQGKVVKDLKTNASTLKELEEHFGRIVE
jgi:ABC-2 type transport system ATP-binding protein